MATVYRAHQPNIGRDVAIKVIRANLIRDEKTVQRFQREARLIARLEHPHILPVYDFDGAHDPPYIVMRYLDGGTLKDVVRRGVLPSDEVLHLLRQVGAALEYAHRQGVVHRDIKPTNIMIDREGNAFLTDLGIARIVNPQETDLNITGTDVIVGTPDYMAPEQTMDGDTVDHRADIYALGAVTYEMLTGETPFDSNTPTMLMLMHMREPVPSAHAHNESLPVAVDNVIETAMGKVPEDRYDSVSAFIAALEDALHGAATASSTNIQQAIRETTERRGTVNEGEARQMTLAHSRNITALYASVEEYAQMVREEIAIQALIEDFVSIISDHGGELLTQSEYDMVGLWGLQDSGEDDPERAVQAALALQNRLRLLGIVPENAMLPLNIGITTGEVLLTPSDEDDFSIGGMTVPLAQRIGQSAYGTILMTQGTFRYVRGLFTVNHESAIRVRDEHGKIERINVYEIVGEKSRRLTMEMRGVEGVETALVGRRAEMEQLQKALHYVVEDVETHAITLIGAPGIGKTRLLREFTAWADLRPERFRLLRGRAVPGTQHQPYALLRDLIENRFDLQDDDDRETTAQKLNDGVRDLIDVPNPEMAHLVGYLFDCDLPPTEYTRGDEAQINERAQTQFKRLLVLATRRAPLYLALEDIHFADDASLDLLNVVMDAGDAGSADIPLLVVATARPELLARRPDWASGQDFHTRLEIRPLDKRDSRDLAREILQKVEVLPRKLRDLLVTRAEGNPYYMEELVKMLVEDRVIQKADDVWTVEVSRLDTLTVPPTLVGLLQARLDTLLNPERVVIQRAAVIGRVFYDTAIAALDDADSAELPNVQDVLDMLFMREFIHRRERSAFEGATAYVFAQAMVRDMVYEALLDDRRQAYSLRAAQWLITAAGERGGQFTGLIADYYEQAGEMDKAVTTLHDAADQAERRGAYRDALKLYTRAVDLLPDDETALLRARRGDVLRRLGDLKAAQNEIEAAVQATEDEATLAQAQRSLGLLAIDRGDFAEAQRILTAVLPQVETLGDTHQTLLTLQGLGITEWQQGDYDAATDHIARMRELAVQVGSTVDQLSAINLLGIISIAREDYTAARDHLQAMQTLARKTDSHNQQIIATNNLGEIARLQGDYATAQDRFEQALLFAEEREMSKQVIAALMNLGDVALHTGDYETARDYLRRALRLTHGGGLHGQTTYVLTLFARLRYHTNDPTTALELLGVVEAHPLVDDETRQEAERVLDEMLADGISADGIERGLARGNKMSLTQTVERLLV